MNRIVLREDKSRLVHLLNGLIKIEQPVGKEIENILLLQAVLTDRRILDPFIRWAMKDPSMITQAIY